MKPKITSTSVQLKYALILAGLAFVGLVVFAAAAGVFQRVGRMVANPFDVDSRTSGSIYAASSMGHRSKPHP